MKLEPLGVFFRKKGLKIIRQTDKEIIGGRERNLKKKDGIFG